MSKIEDFARSMFGIKLTQYQLQYMEAITDNKILLSSRRTGLTTANKIIRAYIKDGITQPTKDNAPRREGVNYE